MIRHAWSSSQYDIVQPNTARVSTRVMGDTILAYKLARRAPDLIIRPNVAAFRLLDFLRASAILRAADPVKAEVKARLAAMLQA